MKKNLTRALLALFVVAVLAGCEAAGKPTEGLLSEEEIARYESVYLRGKDSILQDLGLKEDDISGKDFGQWPLKEPRSISGFEAPAFLLVSEPETTAELNGAKYEGLYGVYYNIKAEKPAAVKDIYEDALELYGEPDTYPGLQNRISENLDELDGDTLLKSYEESWFLGERTTLTLAVSPYPETEEFRISVNYHVTTLRNGQVLDPVTQEPLEVQRVR